MYIKYLQLFNYRNYKKLDLELSKGVNIFLGDNAQGKTNILEGIYYCGLAKSHRTSKDKELIKWNENEAYIKIYISKERLDKKIEIKIFKEGKKAVNINSIKITKIADLIGTFNVVMFSPEDLKIVKESPTYRRKFLDIELCQLSKKYYYNLVQYNKVLNERNTILKKWQTKNLSILDIYDEQISVFGAFIIRERIKYINALNEKGKMIHNDITSGIEKIEFEYMCSIKKMESLAEELKQELLKSRNKDIEKRITSIGPHRDDFSIMINNIDTRSYGSQGQQRTAILTIKFASLEIIKEQTGEYPVLLLDDVLSELDNNRQRYILNSIKNVQTIITCTGIRDFEKYTNEKAKIYEVKEGVVQEVI